MAIRMAGSNLNDSILGELAGALYGPAALGSTGVGLYSVYDGVTGKDNFGNSGELLVDSALSLAPGLAGVLGGVAGASLTPGYRNTVAMAHDGYRGVRSEVGVRGMAQLREQLVKTLGREPTSEEARAMVEQLHGRGRRNTAIGSGVAALAAAIPAVMAMRDGVSEEAGAA